MTGHFKPKCTEETCIYFFLLIPVSVSGTVPTADLMGDKAMFPAKCNARIARNATNARIEKRCGELL